MATTTPTSAPEWEQVASFGMAGGWQWVTDVTGGADGYLAVGKRAELTGDQGWYTAAQYLWASTDGLSWEEVPPAAMSPEIPGWFAQQSTPAWVSIDGISWKRLPLDEGAAVTTGAAWSDGVLLAGISSEAGGSAAFWVDRATLRPVIH